MARRDRSSIIQTPRHAIVFFTMFILGAILLSFAKIINLPSGWDKVIIVGLSLLLMLTYAFFITIVPATRLRLDTAADNMYYLGFLYTLTSLAVALTIDDTDQILANFGVAISSTLIGIAARVGLNQLRVDPHDIEAASRLELSEATSRIRSEMDDAVLQLSSFRTMNLQVLTEGYEEIQASIRNITEEMHVSLNEMIKKTSDPLDELAKKTSEANKKITESLIALKSSSDELVESNKTAVKQIGRVNTALSKLQKHYSDTGIVDDKVVSAVQEQLLSLQNQLTKDARLEFEKLTASVQKNSEYSEELKSELGKYFQQNVDQKSPDPTDSEDVPLDNDQRDTTDNDQGDTTKDGPWGSRKSDVLRNSSVPSLYMQYKGHNIYTYPTRQGYFWEGSQFSSSSDAISAIDAKLSAK